MKYKLGDVAKITRGISYKSSDYSTKNDISAEAFVNLKCIAADGFKNEGIKYYKGKHKKDQSACVGDLLIANTDLTRNREVIGNSIIVPKLDRDRICFSHHLTKITILDQTIIDKKYLYYLLKSPKVRAYMVGNSDGTTVVMLPAKAIQKLEVDLPDLATQQKIVRIFSALDNKIELNTQQNETLEKTASELINSFQCGQKQTTKLSDIMFFDNGYAFKSRDYVSKGKYKIITIKNVKDGSINSEGAQCLEFLPKDIKKHHRLEVGDILLSLTGNVGRAGIVFENDLLLNQRIAKVHPKNEMLRPFLYFTFRQEAFKSELENLAKGTAQLNLSPVETLNQRIPYEERAVVKLNKKLCPLFEKLISNKQQSKQLSNVRDVLLLRLLDDDISLREDYT